MMKLKKIQLKENESGRVAVPILMYMLGVPFTLVFFAWLFFFRG